MKKIIKLISLFSIVLLMSCNESAEYKDVILFTGTESSATRRFIVEGPESMGVSVTATDKVAMDTDVKIKVNSSLIDRYNEKTGKNFKMAPETSYDLSSSNLLIKKGTSVSESASLNLVSFEDFEEGVSYCIPLEIEGTTGDMSILEPSRFMYVEIMKKTVTKAARLQYGNAFNIPSFMNNSDLEALGKITMECRVLINSFPGEGANPGISSLMGIEENFLLRFGDISIEKNRLQLAPGIVGGKKYFTTGDTRYATNRWYHVAAVFDGTSIAIYVDGKLDVKFSVDQGTASLAETLADGFWIGRSAGGRYLDGAISEARVWKRALTPSELEENLCFVDPTAEGLIAYWRFNDVQDDGSILDATGHGHNAQPLRKVAFIEGVKCPN